MYKDIYVGNVRKNKDNPRKVRIFSIQYFVLPFEGN